MQNSSEKCLEPVSGVGSAQSKGPAGAAGSRSLGDGGPPAFSQRPLVAPTMVLPWPCSGPAVENLGAHGPAPHVFANSAPTGWETRFSRGPPLGLLQ